MALIIIAILVTVSAIVSMLIQAELEFSILSRESQKAFFASDAGTECAIYWDIRGYAFATSSPGYQMAIDCANFSGIPAGSDKTGAGYHNFWEFAMTLPNDTCVEVKIDKTSQPTTLIYAYGYNGGFVSANECDVSGVPELVERGLRVSY